MDTLIIVVKIYQRTFFFGVASCWHNSVLWGPYIKGCVSGPPCEHHFWWVGTFLQKSSNPKWYRWCSSFSDGLKCWNQWKNQICNSALHEKKPGLGALDSCHRSDSSRSTLMDWGEWRAWAVTHVLLEGFSFYKYNTYIIYLIQYIYI